jgi:hypothetical protein
LVQDSGVRVAIPEPRAVEESLPGNPRKKQEKHKKFSKMLNSEKVIRNLWSRKEGKLAGHPIFIYLPNPAIRVPL